MIVWSLEPIMSLLPGDVLPVLQLLLGFGAFLPSVLSLTEKYIRLRSGDLAIKGYYIPLPSKGHELHCI